MHGPSIVLLALLLVSCEKPQSGETFEVKPSYPDEQSGIWLTKPSSPTPTPIPTGWIKIQQDRWDKAQIRPEKVHYVQALSASILRNKTRYTTVYESTRVPWFVIGAIHNMECSQSFRQNLANGDPLTAKTRHVPAGRIPNVDPPYTWEQGAIDALRFDKMDKKQWYGIGYELNNIELYNGAGYQKFHSNTPSPYLWSWTTIYSRGKYVADGKWSDTAVSDQCGVCPILKTLNAQEK